METLLNPDLDARALAAAYREDDRVRVENILKPEVAERIRACMASELTFDFVHFRNGRNESWGVQDMQGKSQAELQEIQKDIWRDAQKGIGFQYGGYLAAKADLTTANDNLRFLHSVFDYLSGDEVLSFINEVTGRGDIRSANAQYTKYSAGHFLTRHRDQLDQAERRVAYVLGFSKDWHPDWGGLLQFYEEDGTPRDAWTPKFNCLNLFDIRHIHAVTFVTPFAGEPRLSLTGWFQSKAR